MGTIKIVRYCPQISDKFDEPDIIIQAWLEEQQASIAGTTGDDTQDYILGMHTLYDEVEHLCHSSAGSDRHLETL